MPQLDFYSYVSQLMIVFIVSFIIYSYLIKVLLPTIGITLKIRAYIIENKTNMVNHIVDVNKKSEIQLYLLLEQVSELLSKIENYTKEENLMKEILLILVQGQFVAGLLDEDFEEEFLLQSLRVRLIGVEGLVE